MSKSNISYHLDDITVCKNDNVVMDERFKKYCNSLKYKDNDALMEELFKPMEEIIKSHFEGINPNDISLMNIIRDNMNKIKESNFDTIIEVLKTLYYTSVDNFKFLADELITRSMNDSMASKGFNTNEGELTPSDIYMKVALEFKDLCIKDEKDEKPTRFLNIYVKSCSTYFDNFTDITMKLDKFNPHRVSIFKGFMNMIGLMYKYNIFPYQIIIKCLEKLVNIITDTENGLVQEERDNYYTGYVRIVDKVLQKMDNEIINEKEFSELYEFMDEKNELITSLSSNKKKADDIIKRFSILTHNDNIERLEKINEKYNSKGKSENIEISK